MALPQLEGTVPGSEVFTKRPDYVKVIMSLSFNHKSGVMAKSREGAPSVTGLRAFTCRVCMGS